mmetsp:Transcript_18396/g.48447  ORF Transcript_18396/g.48447 Transcript_18396/m.48447 type:complete len:103 (+) Transcript_18396:173-481(+)
MYSLPTPILSFAEASLCNLLSSAPASLVLEAFVLAQEYGDERLRALREDAAYWVVRGWHDLLCDGRQVSEPACILSTALGMIEAVLRQRAGGMPQKPSCSRV